MDYINEYEKWLESDVVDNQTKAELLKIKEDEAEIKESFYTHLEFGTGGLRGVLGNGTNRMNKYVVRRATQGIAEYIKSNGDSNRGVAIAYDCRYQSAEFALETALVFCANNIKAYLFDELRPTPELSFAVRHLNAIAGIVITASHNPAKYNGYKAYWEDGGQIPPTVSDKVLEAIDKIDMFEAKTTSKEEALQKGLLQMIGAEVDEAYINAVYKQAINKDVVARVADSFKLIYTPIHGSGNKSVRAILKKSGFKNVLIVKEQEQPDSAFSTVKSPNPEDKACFDIAIKMAKENNVDLIIGTDPDADRMGIVVKNKQGEYVTMTGNQVGAMLTDYILTAKKQSGTLPKNGAVISTIVSTKMAEVLTKSYGMKYIETLTGFKFIGEKIYEFETNKNYEFLFGFEESYGYLAGTHARDKDAVVASMLVAEMAAYYSEKGMTLYDAMQELYAKFGGFAEETASITMEGSEGIAKIKQIMERLREEKPTKMGSFNVLSIRDYKAGIEYDLSNKTDKKLELPKSDVLYFDMSEGVSVVVRPSGTEPKIKLYYLISSKDEGTAKQLLEKAKKEVTLF